MVFKVLVLGGYGTFGSRIARRLAITEGCSVIVGGRNTQSAEKYARELSLLSKRINNIDVTTAVFDAHNANMLKQVIQENSINCVVHTAGPFQNHDNYKIAKCIIENGSHYIDIADARRYICDFKQTLDGLAKQHNVVAVTGASSVPAISSAVLDHMIDKIHHENPMIVRDILAPDLNHCDKRDTMEDLPVVSDQPTKLYLQLHHIDIGINPGNQTPRGIATVASILSYCGKPIAGWKNGTETMICGWQDVVSRAYPLPYTPQRYIASCDVPDIELFPVKYNSPSVSFKAGLELSFLTLSTFLLSKLVQVGLISNLANYASPLAKLSELLKPFGSTCGAMHVEIEYSLQKVSSSSSSSSSAVSTT